jgi:sulfhydrogenase subunit alpha
MTQKDEDKNFKVKVGARSRTLHVDYLARVEGEGSLHIQMKEGKVESARLNIFEPPRFFEALLRGRPLDDAPDITARICGICPVAYQMSSVYAMERALRLELPEYLHQLRRLIYCGEWIESHALHIYMLHAPDFYGATDAIALAKKDPSHIRRGLRIKKAGNEIIRLLGGREVHPINVKVGGFYKLPKKEDLTVLKAVLEAAVDDALEGLSWVSSFTFPFVEKKVEHVCLRHPKEYPMARGEIITSSGLLFTPEEMLCHIREEHIEGSTALYATLHSKPYLVGPIARFNLNFDLLPTKVHREIERIGLHLPCLNPYQSIIIRSIEILFALYEALRIIDDYEEDSQISSLAIHPKEGWGYSATEAPRGLLYHHFHIDENGVIQEAKIIPPTSQNQKTIEEDLFVVAQRNASACDDTLRCECERAIRNFDPCISCATHFLSLKRTYG